MTNPETEDTDQTEIEPGYRFRVDRVNSISVGCHRSSFAVPLENVAEEFDESDTVTARNLPNICDIITATQEQQEPNIRKNSTAMPSHSHPSNVGPPPVSGNARRLSYAGIVGGRRRSSNLPELEDFGSNTVGIYGKSLYRYTNEAIPKMDNYRNMMSISHCQRPTIDELHDPAFSKARQKEDKPEEPKAHQVKFGWIEGCLVRCLLNIWGVMLFLRLSWMVAQAGLVYSLLIIAVSTVVTTITTLSMSAVSTNGEIKGGGIYYMISRSLGPEWGGAIGVVFSFANAGMAALNIVGFSESAISMMSEFGVKIVDGGVNDNRIISCVAVVILQSIIVIGMEWEAKVQVGLLVVLLVAMLDFVVGAFMGPQSDIQFAKGWIGMNSTLIMENSAPGFREGESFFTVFSIFFPAVAGIQAGASISGDLKDPGEAIPKGTLLAIFITSASYVIFAIFAGAGTLREATGNTTDIDSWAFSDCANKTCKWGLYNDFQVMELMSIFGPLIYAGCFAATLSSALSCLVSGPKTFQALCKDKVYPYLTKCGKGYGKTDDPYWSYAVGFVIAFVFILIGDLNAIAPLISNFFMAAYALLNFCTFHASLVKPLGWRPTFRYYNIWVSLLGAILCVVVMFLMNWVTALISLGCVIALYAYVIYRKPDMNWGTSTQAQTYSDALNALQTLSSQEEHVKNYRPQILCLTGFPSHRPALVDFAHLITKKQSLLICGHICNTRQTSRLRRAIMQSGYEFLGMRKVRGFYAMVDNCAFDEGVQSLHQTVGIGKLAPNILLMGYKSDWQICERHQVTDYFTTVHEALDNYMAIAILRVKDGLDCSPLMLDDCNESGDYEESGKKDLHRLGSVDNMAETYENGLEYDPSDPDATANTDAAGKTEVATEKSPTQKKRKKLFGRKRNKSADDLDLASGVNQEPESDGNALSSELISKMSLFQTKQPQGNVDVWWLYDDGGLTLLLPYIITTRKNWSGSQLRLFTLANKKEQMEQELRGMAALLSKFRIDYADLTVIPDITKRAEDKTKQFFDSLIKDFKGDPTESDNPDMVIGDSELLILKEKTNRHLRLRELLLQHSSNSNLVVMTLPVPRKGTVSAPLYMAWLETLTRDMPPFLLVRGNQTSVLTFYS